jgi:hypothetical protein
VNLYRTTDIAASVHKAHAQFTHVVLNRAYTLHNPVFFNSKEIIDLPLYEFADWIPATMGQLEKWRTNGGVLVDRNTIPVLECDALVLVECPISQRRIDAIKARECVVIPDPVAWSTHDDYIDLKFPMPDLLREVWRIAAGKEMTNVQLAAELDVPVRQIHYLKLPLKPTEFWYIQKRLVPERDEFVQAWDWLPEGRVARSEISKAGYRAVVEEMARFGYIGLQKMNHYPQQEPNWRQLRKAREAALKDLAAVRLLVESLPDHLQT